MSNILALQQLCDAGGGAVPCAMSGVSCDSHESCWSHISQYTTTVGLD